MIERNAELFDELVDAASGAHRLLDALLSFYGQGLEVLNWHLNGDTELFDNFVDDNSDGTELAALAAVLDKLKVKQTTEQ